MAWCKACCEQWYQHQQQQQVALVKADATEAA